MLNVTQLIRGKSEIGTQQPSSLLIITLFHFSPQGTEESGQAVFHFSFLSQFLKGQAEIPPLTSRTVNL